MAAAGSMRNKHKWLRLAALVRQLSFYTRLTMGAASGLGGDLETGVSRHVPGVPEVEKVHARAIRQVLSMARETGIHG